MDAASGLLGRSDAPEPEPTRGHRRAIVVAAVLLGATGALSGLRFRLPHAAAALEAVCDDDGSLLYVAVDGDDASACGPMRTVRAAVARARAADGASRIVLGGGVHFVDDAPLILGAEDAGLAITGENDDAVVSGGLAVPDDCWETTEHDGVWRCGLSGSGSTAALADRSRRAFRSLRIGTDRATPARYPAAGDTASSFLYCNQTYLLGDRSWAVTLASAADGGEALPDWLLAPEFGGASVRAWPIYSWNNFEGPLRRASPSEMAALGNASLDASLPWFAVDCNLPSGSACDAWDGNLDAGSRLYVFGARAALDVEGEWLWDADTDDLFVYASERPGAAFVPSATTVLHIGVAEDVALTGLTFRDCDYASYGFQVATNPGIPHDAAVRVHGAVGARIANCTFAGLGGGGILVTESAARATITGNTFSNLGQSAVFLSGTGETQPILATISDNAIDGVGEILAASGGIVCAACSHASIVRNVVTRSARWGINVKTSSTNASYSTNNTIGHNVFSRIGLATADVGGVYFVADGGDTRLNATVVGNRITDAAGVKSTWTAAGGELETPASSYGVYLDNSASGVTVVGNVVANVATGAYFVHEGRSNHFFNNVAFNVSNARNSGGINKAVSGGTGEYYARGRNNTFARNVVAFRAAVPTRTLWYGDSDALGNVDRNLYYAHGTAGERFQLFYNNSQLTPAGNWTEWRRAGKDASSTIGDDPAFVDAGALDLCLAPGSPAFALGFEALPASVCRGSS